MAASKDNFVSEDNNIHAHKARTIINYLDQQGMEYQEWYNFPSDLNTTEILKEDVICDLINPGQYCITLVNILKQENCKKTLAEGWGNIPMQSLKATKWTLCHVVWGYRPEQRRLYKELEMYRVKHHLCCLLIHIWHLAF